MSPVDILDFWFKECTPRDWFAKSDAFDRLIKHRFTAMHHKACNAELYEWRNTAHGRLAEIIIIDQFSRNIFRDKAQAFASDLLGIALSQEAINCGADQQLNPNEKSFLYMPLMHSESLVVHQLADKVFQQNGLEQNYEFELKHKVIIERFGRYPHRNAILGRSSTSEEIAFLQQPGSHF